MENCIFCEIVNGEIPSFTIYENEKFKVFLDLGPAAKGHCLIIPKEHYENIFEMPDELVKEGFLLAKEIAKKMKEKLGCSGINIVQNNGSDAGQTVFHFHIHVIPRYENDNAKFGWNEGKLTEEVREEILSLFL